MTLKNLDNLVQINQLKVEPSSKREFEGLLRSARARLKDSGIRELSIDGRFDLVYNAAHGFALAALRWHGYRSDSRFIVFQCLEHTVNLEKYKCKILSNCHNKRNRAEYDGDFGIEEPLLEALVNITVELSEKLEKFDPVTE